VALGTAPANARLNGVASSPSGAVAAVGDTGALYEGIEIQQ
jgi:hypothetical protein